MAFKPLGGFPSIIRKKQNKEEIEKKINQPREMQQIQKFVSIGKIMDGKKKEDFLSAFGQNDNDAFIDMTPYQYSEFASD